MKISITTTIVLLFSAVISINSFAGNKAQLTWAGNVVKHIQKYWNPKQDKSSEFKNQQAKVKFTVSNNGQILGVIDLSCQGSLTFCSSVSRALVKARPFPVPPVNLTNLDRTIIMNFN